MARLARLFVQGHPQLIRLALAPGRSAFSSKACYEYFLQLMRTQAQRLSVSLHAHALLPDQVLALVSCASAADLGRWVQAINRIFGPWVLQQTGQPPGSVWAPRFKSTVIQPGPWELMACIWVDKAPQRLRINDDPVDYAWSSMAAHTGVVMDRTLVDLPQYWALGNTPFERQSRYRALAERDLSMNQLRTVEWGLNKGWMVGDPAYIQSVAEAVDRPVAPRPRGRPRGKTLPANTP